MLILMFMMMTILLIALIMMMLNFLISKMKNTNREKYSPFECGFDPLSPARLPFSIQFYMISIIFLIFDIEIIIILPFISSLLYSSMEMSIFSMIYFILILIIGLFIEWEDGALKWLK